MSAWQEGESRGRPEPVLVVAAAGVALVTVTLALIAPVALPAMVPVVLGMVAMARRLRAGAGLQTEQIDRLHQAELALATAASTHDAARQLADHAIALLGARAATVLIEGIGDTVRVDVGEGTVYGDGSRMRLLDDAGLPCGSIAVSARADGRPFTAAQERILDALAQRVSSTLHRLSLFTEVQAERRTLRDVLTSSSDGIFTVGRDLAVRSWNPAMERITGISADDAVSHPVGAVFRPTAVDGTPRHGSADPGRRDRPRTELVRIECHAGEHRWLTCSWSPLSEGGYAVVARDDTERKKLQDDKDGWIAQVSHELRTPLTPLKGFIHTLQRRGDALGDEDRHRIYAVMAREEQRLEDLVSSLLQATSLVDQAAEAAIERVDWRRVLAEQVEVYRRADPSRDVHLSVPEGLAPVLADPGLATAVVVNLLSNALKYSPAGTPVWVQVDADADWVVTTVADSGPGVPAGDRDRIFDKFTRLGDHLTRPQQGVGLGLFITRRSVEAMGGEVWCDERPGGGARFGFRLPAAPPEGGGLGGSLSDEEWGAAPATTR